MRDGRLQRCTTEALAAFGVLVVAGACSFSKTLSPPHWLGVAFQLVGAVLLAVSLAAGMMPRARVDVNTEPTQRESQERLVSSLASHAALGLALLVLGSVLTSLVTTPALGASARRKNEIVTAAGVAQGNRLLRTIAAATAATLKKTTLTALQKEAVLADVIGTFAHGMAERAPSTIFDAIDRALTRSKDTAGGGQRVVINNQISPTLTANLLETIKTEIDREFANKPCTCPCSTLSTTTTLPRTS